MSVTILGQWFCWRQAGRITLLFKRVCVVAVMNSTVWGGVVRTRFLKSSHFSLFPFLLIFPRALAQLLDALCARRTVDSST